MNTINVTSAPKTATFQMRINPEVKQRMEDIYARQGLSFTDAVNIFIQQSLNMEGLPFLASPENAEYMKAKAMRRLLDEVQKAGHPPKRMAGYPKKTLTAPLGWPNEAKIYAGSITRPSGDQTVHQKRAS